VSEQAYWNQIYKTKQPDQVSWYAPHLARSLALIKQVARNKDLRIFDVGSGESTFVDDLLADGYTAVSVLDISEVALSVAQARLGVRIALVNWYVGDVTTMSLPENHVDVWHDRAVFHFLTDPLQKALYVNQVMKSVKPGGYVIVAAFGPYGPPQCSGLDIVRYSPVELQRQFGD
jgi:SAM-dependent methyltransferase